MIWQDIVLMTGGFLFVLSLIPSVRGKNKPEKLTCLTTGGILVAFAISYATLDLWLACTSTSLTSLTWFVLLAQERSK